MNNHVQKYSPDFENEYKHFVENHFESMFFQSGSYVKLLSELLNCKEEHLLYFDEGLIKGVLPLMSKTGVFGKVYNSLPYYGSNGGVLANTKEIAFELIKEYNKLIKEVDVASSTCVENPLLKNNYKESIIHNLTDYRIGQFTSISYYENHADKLIESFHYKTRNMVRKGMKTGLHVKVDNTAIDFLADTHENNMKAIGGKPKPRIFFDLITKHFVADKDYKIWVAYNGEVPVAALLLFYYRDMVEYYSPVIVEEYRDKQPLSLLIYEAMIESSQRGFNLWNWGGTWANQDGVYTFKKRWGTFEKNYEYYIQINNSEIYYSNKDILLKEYSDFFVLPFNLLKQN